MRVVTAFVLLSIMACGDEGPPPTEPLSAAEADDACGEYCTYRVGCGGDLAACRDWCDPVVDLIRADAARALLACYLAQSCDAPGEQGCLAETIDGLEPTATYHETRRACEAMEGRCGVYYGCGTSYYVLLADGVLATLTDCFALECGAVESCVVESLASF
jgi:hypothetical protein